ncbi:MAG: glycosyltransferase [Bacteroidota bacterium]
MKKVLHISYDHTPGAGSVPKLFHEEMKKRGISSKFLVYGRKVKAKDDVIPYFNPVKVFFHRVNLAFRLFFSLYGNPKYFFFNLNEKKNHLSAQSILQKVKFKPDIIIFYWTSRMLNTQSMAELYKSTGAKIYWVMTDMAPYTGGCHYAWGCKGFEDSCKACPAIGGNRAAVNLQTKKEQLKDVPMTIIASAGDSYENARRSSLFKGIAIKEHYLKVRLSSSIEYAKTKARKRLGLKETDLIFFIGASNFKDERKGMQYFMEAANMLSNRLDPEIKRSICFAHSSKKGSKIFDQFPFRTSPLGYLDFKSDLLSAFIASDVHISSSIMDTGPYMVNLSMAYGCPVLSFDIGIAKALVINGQTGFKSKEISAEGLADAMHSFIEHKLKGVNFHENCIRLAKEKLYWTDSSLELFGLSAQH